MRCHALRYLIVVAAHFAGTASLACCLHRIGAHNIISMYLPVAVTLVPIFVLIRGWVFKNPVTFEVS